MGFLPRQRAPLLQRIRQIERESEGATERADPRFILRVRPGSHQCRVIRCFQRVHLITRAGVVHLLLLPDFLPLHSSIVSVSAADRLGPF